MPTIRRCCIVGCLSNSRQNPQLQFFQFPKQENPFHKLWKQACHASLSRILPFKKPVVCALHFHPNCIGGRRLTASAVPSQRLEVPTNLKAVEQQAMVEEIERSRKCAYINAVVYEWLVRANLNPQLRGSITHGMIKEKAETAKQLIGSTTFFADNRWLNRFRETHLTGFAQKLASNQLKPIGPSLWIPEIVQDLQHLFPPTSADRGANFENVPEQYMDYMQQYGEYEEDDDQKPDVSLHDQSYYDQQQQQHHHQQQQQQQHHHHIHSNSYDQYAMQHQAANYNSYDDYYYERQNQSMREYSPQQHQPIPMPQRPPSHSPSPQQLTHSQSHSNRSSPFPVPAKRTHSQDDIDDSLRSSNDQVEDLTDGPEPVPIKKIKLNGSSTPNGISRSHESTPSPKPTNGQTNGNGNANGNVTPPTTPAPTPAPTPVPTPTPAIAIKDLETYAQALEYLKPLEDFALFKENFRAIGLISQLEVILRKGDRQIPVELDEVNGNPDGQWNSGKLKVHKFENENKISM